MRARNLLLALGILAFALVLMLIISSKASAKESDNLQIADGSLVTDELSAVAESGHQITTPSLKPDLAITELKTPGNIKEKDIVAITVKLENLGSGSASNIVTSFYVDGKYIESKETKFMSGSPSGERRLNSNKKECSEKMLVFNWVAQQYGEYLLSFYADSSNAVEELDETNNYYTVTVLVKPTNDYGVSDTAVPTTANIVSSIAGIACAVSLLALLAFALDRYKFYWLISPLY
ncbi:MAG: CARDB domain-containing protein, partial [Candidatus Thermoplasmatota archaeon]